jgi:hypothetical protein
MLDAFVEVIDSLLAFAATHGGGPLDPSAFLTADQIDELETLDTQFYAGCQLSGLSLPIIPDREELKLSSFGHLRLPYVLCTTHWPIKDEAGRPTREMVRSGMAIWPTREWKHAMKCLRATAGLLKAKGEHKGKARITPTASATAAGGDESQGTISNKQELCPGTEQKRGKSARGRPAGSKTQAYDLNLYADWKAAQRETGMTKAEFLQERNLPTSALDAIERGRKRAKARNQPGKK